MEKDTEGDMVDRHSSSNPGARNESSQGSQGDASTSAEDAKEPASIVAELREQLQQEKDRAEENLRQWQRAAADYQNLKRRGEQERGEATRFAQVALVINLLPVYDDLDRALGTVDANLAGLNWVQGISAIHRKFANTLEAMDVHEIDTEDATFDPDQHEAVGQMGGEEGKILHVVQKGYRLGDRVVRPTMVMVGNGQPAADETKS